MSIDYTPGNIIRAASSIIIPFLLILLSDIFNYTSGINSGLLFGFSVMGSIMIGLWPLWTVIKQARPVITGIIIGMYIISGVFTVFIFHMFIGCYIFGDCI